MSIQRYKRKRFTRNERESVHEKTNGKCAYCGDDIRMDTMHIDHVVPFIKGGTNDVDNLLPSCRACNNYKSSATLEEFRAQIETTVNRLRRYEVNYRFAERFGVVRVTDAPVTFFFETIASKE